MGKFKIKFISFIFLICFFFPFSSFSSGICNQILNGDYIFKERFVEKYDHGISLEDWDDPNFSELFIIHVDNFSPAQKVGLNNVTKIYSINDVPINDQVRENFDESVDFAYEQLDRDHFTITVYNDNYDDESGLTTYEIDKKNYLGEPYVISQYYIDRLEIFNLNREAKGRFRVWSDWENPSFIDYAKNEFNNKDDFICKYTNRDNIDKLLQKLWYPFAKIDQTGSTFNITSINSITIDTLADQPFGIEYDIEATVLTDAELKKFPFDTMNFNFDFNYFTGGGLNLIENWEENIKEGINTTNKNLYEWQITQANLEYFQDVFIEDGEEKFGGHNIVFDLKRNTLYYFVKIIIPVIFIVFISFAVFWIKNQELEAKLNVSIVSLLALIAYNFVYNSELPKLNFITIIDAFILISYLYSGMATVVTIYSFYDYRKDGQTGDFNTLDLKLRYLAPISYLILIIVTSLFIYNGNR